MRFKITSTRYPNQVFLIEAENLKKALKNEEHHIASGLNRMGSRDWVVNCGTCLKIFKLGGELHDTITLIPV